MSAFVVGELVWAKMKGYPWWPSKIGRPKPEVKKPRGQKPMHFVEFYGSNTYAWLPDEKIQPFEKDKAKRMACRMAAFKAALEELGPPELLFLKAGFIGLDNVSSAIVKKLVKCGCKVTVWSRSPEEILALRDANVCVDVGRTPAAVVAASDITFSCLSDSTAAKKVVSDVLKEIRNGKSYIEMTSIYPDASRDIAEAIGKREGQYLEVSLFSPEKLSTEDQLIMLAAGDVELYSKCKKYFEGIGLHTRTFFMGEVGQATGLNLLFNMVMGTSLISILEAMSFAKKINISHSTLLEVLKSTACPLHCSFFINRTNEIISALQADEQTSNNDHLQHIQKVLEWLCNYQEAEQLQNENVQALPIALATNGVFKEAERAYGSFNISALCGAYFPTKRASTS